MSENDKCFCGHKRKDHNKYVNDGVNSKGSRYVCGKDGVHSCTLWNLCDLKDDVEEDIGDMWREIKKDGQKKRWSNLQKSTALLVARGVQFKSFNDGIHLRIEDYDFYPSTGYWKKVGGGGSGRGVFQLLKLLEKQKDNNKIT